MKFTIDDLNYIVLESTKRIVNEVHGQKKHNSPKDELHAMRKGNREAERDIFGDGFHSKSKLHRTSKKDKLNKQKINVNNFDKYIDEAIDNTLSVDYSDKEDYGEYYPGLKNDWGKNVEHLIGELSNIFAEYNVPEEDEYGIKNTDIKRRSLLMAEENKTNVSRFKEKNPGNPKNPDNINYDVDVFNENAFNSIYKLLDNYDLTSDEKVKNILLTLKKYC